MNSSKWSWDALLVASIVFAAGALAQSQPAAWADEAAEAEGRIVEIAPAASTELPKAPEQPAVGEQPKQPAYWIGIRGRNVEEPVLRTQFQLAEDLGVVIEEVLEDSPAAKAGIRQHDIILRANGEPVQAMEDLYALVNSGDAKPIELRLIRLGKEETIAVVPEERPAGLEERSTGLPGFGEFGDPDAMRKMMERMPGFPGLPPGGMRVLGGGIFIDGQQVDLNNLPNGVAVTIEKTGEGPAKITVKQGDKTWKIDSDDAKALEQLPEEVRGYVARMMQGPGQFGQFNLDLQKEMEHLLPGQFGQFFQAPVPGPNLEGQQDPVLQKMEELERQLEELQKRLEETEKSE